MKKTAFYYLIIFTGIFLYLYSTFSAGISDRYTLEYRSTRKDIFKRENGAIICILLSNHEPVKFFRIEGWTSSGVVGVRYGKNINIIPRQYYLPVIKSKGKTSYWLRELIADDNQYNEKIFLLTQTDLDSLESAYKIRAYSKTKNDRLISFMNPDMPVTFISLTFLAFVFISIYRYLTSLKIIKTPYQTRLFIFIIFVGVFMLIVSPFILAFELGMNMFNGVNSFPTIPSMFTVYVLVFLVFQYCKNMIKTENFAQRQSIIIVLLLMISFSVEFLIKSIVGDFFVPNRQFGMLHSDFWITPISQRMWVIFVIANFFSNLLVYISSLRRKSRLVQSSHEEAQKSLNMLQDAQLKINHHFLFNSLHALSAISSLQPEKTEKLALSLATYYRYFTNRLEKKRSTVEDEMVAVSAYMAVEKIRFNDKLVFETYIPVYVDQEKLPRVILPTLVEYAVKNGYNPTKDLTEIKLTITKVDDSLSIKIYDSGSPYDQDKLSSPELIQIRKMLKDLYHDNFTLSFENDPKNLLEITLKSNK